MRELTPVYRGFAEQKVNDAKICNRLHTCGMSRLRTDCDHRNLGLPLASTRTGCRVPVISASCPGARTMSAL